MTSFNFHMIYSGFSKIIEDTPENLWQRFNKTSEITEEEFFAYFKGAKKAYAIEIGNSHKFEEAINPYFILDNFTPPQSFLYIDLEQDCLF